MSLERFEIFKSQNLEHGLFDVTFEVEGKLIHAHKFMLASISPIFQAMFSTNWHRKETIKITRNTYDEFLALLIFIYSGNCDLNDKNIFTMVDTAEAYQYKSLLQKCDQYLSSKNYKFEEGFELFKTLSNYSLLIFEKQILIEVKNNCPKILETEEFLTWPKEIIEKIVAFEDRIAFEELLFQKVYEWAEHQVIIKQQRESLQNEELCNLYEVVKTEMTPFLPFFKFKKMKLSFVIKYIVKRSFLFSGAELSEILESVNPNVEVKVTDSFGRSIYGLLPRDSEVVEIIKSLKTCRSNIHCCQFVMWNTNCQFCSIPTTLRNRYGWYLICHPDKNGIKIGVSYFTQIHATSLILAEMKTENSGFKPDSQCKIEIE